MWVFYLISLPLTMGMVGITLWYFAGPDVARYVRFTVGYTWFCSVSIIILVPADIWTTIVNHDKGGISFFWSWSYWSTFLLTWGVVPILQGYEDAGDFTVTERLKTSAHVNLISYFCVGSIALCGLVLLIFLRKNWSGSILGFAMACSNTFGLVTGAILLGFGLSEIPKGIWRNADWITRQKVLSHKVAKMAVKLDDAHQEFSNAIVVAQATSKQMSKRDPLMPFMNIVDKMLVRMLSEDPSFKPQGGKLGESDMDYDTDEKSMATLRRQLKRAREGYYRYKSEYMNFVTEALELEDTIKNYEHCSATGWKYSSSFRPERKGKVGTSLDVLELVWRCILRKQLEKLLAIVLGCMSAAILLAEATILPSGVDLSLVSILINAVKKNEMLVQRMGNIDDAVPFFGKGFNKIYPLIMVVYTILIASNFFHHVLDYFGNWKIFRFYSEEADDLDGFDASGLIILQKERSWLEQGYKVGELVVPLARNFNNASINLESGSSTRKAKAPTFTREDDLNTHSKPLKSEVQNDTSQVGISKKYAATRSQSDGQEMKLNTKERNMLAKSSSGMDSTWESMKMELRNFKSNIDAKRFIPLHQVQDEYSRLSSESLDDIFSRIKRPIADHMIHDNHDDLDDYEMDRKRPG